MTTFDSRSFYKKTSNDGFFLGYYEPVYLPFHSTDYYMVIPTEYDLKPGMLAYKLYGNAQLMWIFSVYNRDVINDPLFDFRAGTIIRVPTKDRLSNIL